MDPQVHHRLASEFTLADVLGYVVPGAAFFISIFTFEAWAAHIATAEQLRAFRLPLSTSLSVVIGEGGLQEGWFVYLLIAIMLVFVIYVGGHVIESVSVLLVDRLLVYKGYGYPYENLLVIHDGPSGPDAEAGWKFAPAGADSSAPAGTDDPAESLTLSRAFYRGLFFWTNGYLVLRWIWYLLGTYDGVGRWRGAVGFLALAVGVWVGVMVVLKIALSTVRTYRRKHGGSGGREGIQTAERYLRLAYSGLWELLIGGPLSKIFLTRLSFDREFRTRYQTFFRQLFGLNPHTAESNNFWMSYSYVLRRSARLFGIVSHWEALFTFSRNLSTSLFLAFLYCLCWLQFHNDFLPGPLVHGGSILVAVPGVLLGLSAILLVHFYYLYVCYYSKFLYRSFVFLAQTEGNLTARPAERPARCADQPAGGP
ncbi:MAG TPA: hypothetical protein VEW03_05235 [Longimicrobiaceae bacterium]|nr:hypothetical protein [Longimicrobiaceae bacterium]